MWFLLALASTLLWGAADLFYKRSADGEERYSHLKTSIAVGLVMGLHAILTLIFGGTAYDFRNILYYLPVSLCYILSMTVGYLGLRYLALSVSSPVQNTSGAFAALLCFFVLGETLDGLSLVGVVFIAAGLFFLGILERREALLEDERGERKYRIGFAAFFLPIAYCIIDALGTFFDAYYLDDVSSSPLVGVTEETIEDAANISYELTFLLVAILLSVYVFVIRKEKPNLRASRPRLVAAVFETAGQFFYVYAMSANAIGAAPMIASYSIVSVLLSRLFLKEKLTGKQYLAVAVVLLGILLMGVAEGLAEA